MQGEQVVRTPASHLKSKGLIKYLKQDNICPGDVILERTRLNLICKNLEKDIRVEHTQATGICKYKSKFSII